MATLRTDYKDDIYQGNRKYIQTKNEDGTVSFLDATQYEQEGDYFGANEINALSQAVNEAFQSASDGKIAIKNAITGIDPNIPIPSNPTFQQLADCIEEIETDPYADKETKTGKSIQFTDADDAKIAITAMGGTGSVTVVACGENLFKTDLITDFFISSTGVVGNSSGNKTILLQNSFFNNITISKASSSRFRYALFNGYPSESTKISYANNDAANSITINATNTNVKYILIQIASSSDVDLTSIYNTIMMVIGTSVKPYNAPKYNQLTIPDVTTATYPVYLTSYKGITNVFTLSSSQPTFTAVAKSELWSGRKKVIPDAIQKKDNRVNIPTDATFAQLAAAIGQIETGIDTTDATVTAEYILAGLTAYVNNLKITGTMVNNGAINQALAVNGTYTIPKGYHNGLGKVTQSISTKAAQTYTPGTANQTIAAGQYLSGVQTILGDPDLIPANILNTANIFGVQGAAIAGNRVATGTFTHEGAANFTRNTDGTVSSKNYKLISNLGLSFVPRVIIYWTSTPYSPLFVGIYFRDGFTYNGRVGYCCTGEYVYAYSGASPENYIAVSVAQTHSYIAYE